jgi:hypothetical protein
MPPEGLHGKTVFNTAGVEKLFEHTLGSLIQITSTEVTVDIRGFSAAALSGWCPIVSETHTWSIQADPGTLTDESGNDLTQSGGVYIMEAGMAVLIYNAGSFVIQRSVPRDVHGQSLGSIITANDTHANISATTLRPGEIIFDEDYKSYRCGDGFTPGGVPIGSRRVTKVITADTTLTASDAAVWLAVDSAAEVTLTLNTDVFSVGDTLQIEQVNSGQVTLAGSMTLHNSSKFRNKTAEEFSVIGVRCSSSTTATVYGEREVI